MALEDELNEAFLGKIKDLPWVLNIINGQPESLTDVSTDEFMNGLILLIAGLNENTLLLARELDKLKAAD